MRTRPVRSGSLSFPRQVFPGERPGAAPAPSGASHLLLSMKTSPGWRPGGSPALFHRASNPACAGRGLAPSPAPPTPVVIATTVHSPGSQESVASWSLHGHHCLTRAADDPHQDPQHKVKWSTSATILNYRHSQRRRVSTLFYTLSGDLHPGRRLFSGIPTYCAPQGAGALRGNVWVPACGAGETPTTAPCPGKPDLGLLLHPAPQLFASSTSRHAARCFREFRNQPLPPHAPLFTGTGSRSSPHLPRSDWR